MFRYAYFASIVLIREGHILIYMSGVYWRYKGNTIVQNSATTNNNNIINYKQQNIINIFLNLLS